MYDASYLEWAFTPPIVVDQAMFRRVRSWKGAKGAIAYFLFR